MSVGPTFLVAGAGRCGTTGLVEGLRTHPDVFVTHPKEPHYFALHDQTVDFKAPGDEATINRVAITDRDAYLALYDGAGSAQARGDGSVSTLYYYQRSIPEILAVNPEMRIVIMLREPVDRAFSSYQYMRTRGFEPEESFLAALDAEESRRQADWHHLWHYTEMSRYAESVGAFLEAFPSEQVGIWFYDDLQDNYEGTVSEVLRFIGAPPVEGEATGVPRVNTSGSPRSRLAQRAIWAATRNEPLRAAVKRMTSYRAREFVRRKALRAEGVDHETRVRLTPLFSDDLGKLLVVLGQHDRGDVPAWLAAAR